MTPVLLRPAPHQKGKETTASSSERRNCAAAQTQISQQVMHEPRVVPRNEERNDLFTGSESIATVIMEITGVVWL